MDKVDFDPVDTDSDPKTDESDQVFSKSDQVTTHFDQVTEDMVKAFLRKFDVSIAPLYRYASAREQAKNSCWKIIRCMLTDANVSRSDITRQTDVKPTTLKTLIGHMRKADMIDFDGKTSDGHWVVKLG